MKVNRRRALEVTILIFLTFKSLASSGSDAQQVTQLEQRRADAVVRRDTALLNKITAEDSVRILPSGSVETKSQLLTQLNSGTVTYNSIVVDQLTVKLYGDTAVVTGKSVFRGQKEGKPFAGRCRFSRIWRKDLNGWQEVLFQLTPITEPEK
jgi:ketosteroid isomerase-like protein